VDDGGEGRRRMQRRGMIGEGSWADHKIQISNTIYNAVFRRNYTFVGFVFTSAFAFEM
jgi:hypothetical protein